MKFHRDGQTQEPFKINKKKLGCVASISTTIACATYTNANINAHKDTHAHIQIHA